MDTIGTEIDNDGWLEGGISCRASQEMRSQQLCQLPRNHMSLIMKKNRLKVVGCFLICLGLIKMMG